jgi:hypothetical protein
LIPRDTQLAPINAQEGVICDVAAANFIAKLYDSKMQGRRSERKSKKIVILFEGFVRQSVCMLSKNVKLCL